MKLITQRYPAELNTGTKKRKSNAQQGFTLVELMIAMTIGLIILLVIGTIFTSNRQAFRMQEDNARIQESGRFALEIIGNSIKQAGYAEIPFTGFKVAFAGVAITGADGAAGAPDTLTVQYDGVTGDTSCSTTIDPAEVAAGRTTIQNHFNLDVANAELQCEGANEITPAIPGPPPTGNVILENIEDLQILYGIDTTNDQSANQYIAAPAAFADPLWEQVVTARVCVLIRSEKTNVVVSAAGTYLDCNGVAVAVPADRRLRRAFTGTFNLRNRVNILP